VTDRGNTAVQGIVRHREEALADGHARKCLIGPPRHTAEDACRIGLDAGDSHALKSDVAGKSLMFMVPAARRRLHLVKLLA
jgi:hypothetical protein